MHVTNVHIRRFAVAEYVFFARRTGAQTRSDSQRGAGENPLRD
jgi:hypothetical protein